MGITRVDILALPKIARMPKPECCLFVGHVVDEADWLQHCSLSTCQTVAPSSPLEKANLRIDCVVQFLCSSLSHLVDRSEPDVTMTTRWPFMGLVCVMLLYSDKHCIVC